MTTTKLSYLAQELHVGLVPSTSLKVIYDKVQEYWYPSRPDPIRPTHLLDVKRSHKPPSPSVPDRGIPVTRPVSRFWPPIRYLPPFPDVFLSRPSDSRLCLQCHSPVSLTSLFYRCPVCAILKTGYPPVVPPLVRCSPTCRPASRRRCRPSVELSGSTPPVRDPRVL